MNNIGIRELAFGEQCSRGETFLGQGSYQLMISKSFPNLIISRFASLQSLSIHKLLVNI